MSCRYSSCRSFSSPNIRSSSTSEKPITAFNGVRNSCDMLARNSDLCREAISNSRLFSFQLAEYPGIEDGQRRLVGERLQHLGDLVRVAARGLAPHDQDADDPVFPKQRHGQHRHPAAAEQSLLMGVAATSREVRFLQRTAGHGPPDRPVSR